MGCGTAILAVFLPARSVPRAGCPCHGGSTGRMPVPRGFHGQDARATWVPRAGCPCHGCSTGRMPVPRGFHGQDARATGVPRAGCPCHGGSTGKMPVPRADCAAFEAGAAAGGTYAANTPAPRRLLIKAAGADAE